MISNGAAPSPLTFCNKPKPVSRVRPPAAETESVQPGKGWLKAEVIIDGLQIISLTFPLFYIKFFSDKFLVNVYVLGKTPM